MQTDVLSLQPLCKPLHCLSVDSCPAATEPLWTRSQPGHPSRPAHCRSGAEVHVDGIPYTRLGIATNSRPEPEYHDVVTWRRLAESAGKYLAKGRLVYVEGWLHGRTWQAEDGTTRRGVEVVAETFRFLTPRQQEQPEGDAQQ